MASAMRRSARYSSMLWARICRVVAPFAESYKRAISADRVGRSNGPDDQYPRSRNNRLQSQNAKDQEQRGRLPVGYSSRRPVVLKSW